MPGSGNGSSGCGCSRAHDRAPLRQPRARTPEGVQAANGGCRRRGGAQMERAHGAPTGVAPAAEARFVRQQRTGHGPLPHMTPSLLFVIGASGAGKTAAVRALDARELPGVRCHYFDSIEVPPAEIMERDFGSGEGWQAHATARWIARLPRRIRDQRAGTGARGCRARGTQLPCLPPDGAAAVTGAAPRARAPLTTER